MAAFTSRKYRGENAIFEDLEAKIIHVVEKSVSPRQDSPLATDAIYATISRLVIMFACCKKACRWLLRAFLAQS
jgi:hypothetical protein